jgi:hypothetical protein
MCHTSGPHWLFPGVPRCSLLPRAISHAFADQGLRFLITNQQGTAFPLCPRSQGSAPAFWAYWPLTTRFGGDSAFHTFSRQLSQPGPAYFRTQSYDWPSGDQRVLVPSPVWGGAIEIILRPNGQSVMVSGTHLGDQILILSGIHGFSCCPVPCLTRRRICNLLVKLLLTCQRSLSLV